MTGSLAIAISRSAVPAQRHSKRKPQSESVTDRMLTAGALMAKACDTAAHDRGGPRICAVLGAAKKFISSAGGATGKLAFSGDAD